LGENQTGNQFLFYFKSDGFSHENSNLISRSGKEQQLGLRFRAAPLPKETTKV
jgi:hypothetical protein